MYARRPQAANSVADPIGLAAELLRPESIARAFVQLDRATLRVLASHDWSVSIRIADRLRELGLVGIDAATAQPAAETAGNEVAQPAITPLPEVDAALQHALTAAKVEWSEFTHDATVPGANEVAAEPDHTAGVWFTPALTTTGEVAECLRMLRTDGLRLNRSGSVGVAAVRELATRAAITPEAVSLALRLLSLAGLTVTASHQLVAAAGAGAWLDQTHQARWLSLARGFLATLPSTLRELLAAGPGGDHDHASPDLADQDLALAGSQLGRACAELTTHYPLLTAVEISAAEQFVSDAESLGCTAHGQLTPLALRLLAGIPVTVADVAEQLPPAATGVYLQPDLTVLSPGPLDPDSEAELASLTSPEQIGPATMRRISEATIAAAFERGISPDQARATFERLSITGIPQPLAYLLQNVAERVGRIMVHEHAGSEGRSRIRVAQTALAETVMVDRQLQHLQLTRAAATQTHPAQAASVRGSAPQVDTAVVLYSRLRPDHVITAFNEARYHASLAGSEAAKAPAASPTAARASTPASQSGDTTARTASTSASAPTSGTTPDPAAAKDLAAMSDPYAALIARVMTAARTEPAAATFTRKLELAIRDKTPVLVTAEARGQRRTFTLLPVSLTDGRLRATDGPAAVERTLPVSMIVSVEPA